MGRGDPGPAPDGPGKVQYSLQTRHSLRRGAIVALRPSSDVSAGADRSRDWLDPEHGGIASWVAVELRLGEIRERFPQDIRP